ncbi:MAG: patatin-like phospholipase family protein [Flavobacteriales bacterium]|nr:patatin-like phospholipase family protein [Flavobacteriales bacterium]
MLKFDAEMMKSALAAIFHLALCLMLVFTTQAQDQRVGIVLSGGGASGIAHVGFLKALEENNIPIDFIAGTSMGAVIGGLYASGYSVAQIDSIVRSDEYRRMATGELEDELRFYFKSRPDDASMATIKLGGDKIISTTLPTNLINPVLFDYNLMEQFSEAAAAAQYDFDSLFVPFRCVASDIVTKEQVVFDRGHLNVAIRASATYPFYLHPIRVDGRLLYDGGLYNNFPSDVIYETFIPDVIIGCTVSENVAPPKEDDLVSQLANMIRTQTNFDLLCDQMVIVEPKPDLGTFDFARMPEAIDDGYAATMEQMTEIRAMIHKFADPEEVEVRRKAFNNKKVPVVIEDVTINGLDRSQRSYVRGILGTKMDSITIDQLKKPYFRLFSDDKIKSIFPVLMYSRSTNKYRLILDVKREKDLLVSFGGNFSSRPINTGFVGLKYNVFRKNSATLSANSYFGKLYGSVHADVKLDFSAKIPFTVEPGFTQNRWDYFRSLATFFEDVKPSFIVANERFAGLTMRVPTGTKSRLSLYADYAYFFDEYYQTEQFLSVDTVDQTVFESGIGKLVFERNTLNRKQFANRGDYLMLSVKYVQGMERTIPGSTSAIRDTTSAFREWVAAKLSYTNYMLSSRYVTLGFHLEGLASTQPFFQNHIATLIAAPAFQPTLESKTLFVRSYHAHNYAAAGLIGIISPAKNFDIRTEAYAYNAIGQIETNAQNQSVYNWTSEPQFIGAATAIYSSPIGPVSFAVNYIDKRDDPWSFVFNFGYLIFNRSVRD